MENIKYGSIRLAVSLSGILLEQSVHVAHMLQVVGLRLEPLHILK